MLPNFIGFFIFTAIPIILGLLISFTDYNGFKWKFVGISNYLKMFGDSQFKAALVNNLVYSVVSVPLTIAFSLILALALNRKLFGGGFFKTVFFFTYLKQRVAVEVNLRGSAHQFHQCFSFLSSWAWRCGGSLPVLATMSANASSTSGVWPFMAASSASSAAST